MFALVDCNNFYASCERVFNPKLNGKPIVVLSNNDGCIIARSNEAKALGIPMGGPFFKIKDTCAKHGVAVFSSNYQLYGDMSRRVMEVLVDACPRVEVYSIDEAFLDLRGWSLHTLEERMRILRAKVLQWTGVPVSIGMARTKTLAKAANRTAKKTPSSGGVWGLFDEAQEQAALQAMPAEDVWGIGHRLGERLRQQGVNTAWDVRCCNAEAIRRQYSVVQQRLVLELQGLSCLALEDVQADKQTIMASRSFGRRVTELGELEQAISSYATRATEKARRGGLVANALWVMIRSSPFSADEPYVRRSTMLPLSHPTADTALVVQTALQGLRRIYVEGPRYAKGGVMLIDLQPASSVQATLFGGVDSPSRQTLMRVMDGLNRTMGKQTLRLASSGMSNPWAMRAESRSNRYTTQWDELARVG